MYAGREALDFIHEARWQFYLPLIQACRKQTTWRAGKVMATMSYIQKCRSPEGIRDLFGFAPHPKGCRSQLTLLLCCPCPFDLSRSALHTLVGILAWGEGFSSRPPAAVHKCSLSRSRLIQAGRTALLCLHSWFLHFTHLGAMTC